MLKGTRILMGEEAALKVKVVNFLRMACITSGYEEVILPVIYEPKPWIERSGSEILGQLWSFEDKGGRPVTLIPEATAIIQDQYNERWSKSLPKPVRVFYVTECFRYERPQAGRWREFTQFGVEILGPGDHEDEAKKLLQGCLDLVRPKVDYEWSEDVERGLSYYTRTGFEASCPNLGASQQVAGGGTYAEGCGWAIGVDRLLLAMETE